ncbi:peptidase M6 [Intrasporangium sp. DVR]|uniref:peptidase M6 n=1 Tax=Intrasporangium sp. DVR TaxID=3127867 RepID=UPI00313A5122
MSDWQRSRVLASGAAALLALGLAFSSGVAASALPTAKADQGKGGSDQRHTGPDYNNGKKLSIDKKMSEKVKGQPPLGPAKVGSVRTWLALDDYRGRIYLKNYTLRGVGDNIEVWVANDRAFPAGDCRNDLGLTNVTDAQVQNFIHEFDSKIYPLESEYFSVPPDRDGKRALLPSLIPNIPSSEYRGEGDKIVTLVDNVRDANYYKPTTPDGQTYIAGFFYSVFNEYFNRNVMTIDAFDWLHRTGANPPDDSADPAYQACTAQLGAVPSRALGLPRPHLYEGVFAHEYQHLLEYYEDPDEASWVNEGLSDWAQTLVGYVDPSVPPDQPGADSHIACFLGFLPESFGGPENSLTGWGDQGGPETLCDYGATYTFMEYFVSHYGADAMTALHREDANGLVGVDVVLDGQGATTSARETVHNWAAAVAVDAKVDAGGALNGIGSDAVTADSLSAKINWDTPEAYTDPGAPPNGSDYVRLRTADGTYLSAADISSITFDGDASLAPDPVAWTVDTTPPGATTAETSCGNVPDGTGDPALYSGCGPNLDRAIVRSVTVPASGGNLTFDALWDAEFGWDYGFVQVSTDNGETWTSLATADTTSAHDPGAVSAIVAELPGFTGDSGTWRPQSASLADYAGSDILVAFRYMTDSGVDEGGFWVRNINAAGTVLPSDTLTGWQSATEVNPVEVQGFTVQLVAYGADGTPVWVHRMGLDGAFDGTLEGAALDAAIGTSASTVAAIVMYDDDTENAPKQAGYSLTVNGVEQPGG